MRTSSMGIGAPGAPQLRGNGKASATRKPRALLATVLVGILGLLLIPVGSANADERPPCTRIIGFSQTKQWAQLFLPKVPDARWEAQIRPGEGVEQWAVGGVGWTTPVFSPCGTVTRVLLQVATTEQRTDAEATQLLSDALGGVRTNVPGASIMLVPVVGGPGGAVCTVDGSSVYASAIYPQMVRLIAAAALGDVSAPAQDLTLGDCAQYQDLRGHLQATGASAVARLLVRRVG